MKQYYFLASALPPLRLGLAPDITFDEFCDLLNDNLTQHDLEKTRAVRRWYDIQNIRAYWKEEELDPVGNFDKAHLAEALLAREGFPDYVYDFLDTYENLEDRLHHFPLLVISYFSHEIQKATGLLHDYLQFEREWRLVFLGFRAKRLGRNLTKELQYEDPDDPLIASLLSQKDAKEYVPPEGYEELGTLFEEKGDSPADLYQGLCEYRFRKVTEMMGIDLFSINNIIGYMVQLITLEKMQELDKEKGLSIVHTVLHPELMAP